MRNRFILPYMPLNHADMDSIVHELKPLHNLKLVSAFAAEPRTFLFNFQSQVLLISLQEPELRFHLARKTYAKTASKLATHLDNKLKNQKLKKIELDPLDKILTLEFETGMVVVELFPKRPNLYLLDPSGRILASLNPAEGIYKKPIPPPLRPAQSNLTSEELETRIYDAEREAKLALFKEKVQKEIAQLEKKLLKALAWESLQHKGDFIKAYMDSYNGHFITGFDWQTEKTVTLKIPSPPTVYMKELYEQSKSLKDAIAPLQNTLSEKKLSLEASEVPEVKKKNKEPFLRFKTAAGVEIIVGKNAKTNDLITFKMARGNDTWLHVDGVPGSHVIVRAAELDGESLEDAAQVAIHHSQARARPNARILVTQRKFVAKPPRSSPGQVQVSRFKIYETTRDPERYKKLRQI